MSLAGIVQYADATTVSNVTIECVIDSVGNAYFKEEWSIDATEDFSDWMLKQEYNDNLVLGDVMMWMDGQPMTFKPRWDSDASRDEIVGRYGISSNNIGYLAICWGLPLDGEHKYVVTYSIRNFIRSYKDGDGFAWRFVPKDINAVISKVNVMVRGWNRQLFFDDSSNYFMSGFKGKVAYSGDGRILITNTEELGRDNTVAIVVLIKKGLIDAQNKKRGGVSDLINRAMSGEEWGMLDDEVRYDRSIFLWSMAIIVFVCALLSMYNYFFRKEDKK